MRNWLKELEGYIPFERKKNGYHVFKNEGLERFNLIKYLNRNQDYTLKRIFEKLTKQNLYIEHSLKERDEDVTGTMRAMLEGEKLIAAAEEHEKQPEKKGWLRSLLGR